MEQLGSHWTDFQKNWYSSIFRKFVENIQASLRSDRIMGNLHEDQYTFWSSVFDFFIEWDMFQTKVAEKIKTRFLCSITFFKILPLMRSCGKILASRAVHRWQYGACALHADTYGYKHILRICNTSCSSTATMVAQTRLAVTWYVHCLTCLSYYCYYLFVMWLIFLFCCSGPLQ
jgi:hypothetical protein